MTILHVDTGREMRGGQYQVNLLMNGLRSQGHECLLLARPQSPLARVSKDGGFCVFPASIREIWVQSRKANIVHAHDARAHSLAAIASQKPFVVSRRVAFPIQRSLLSRWKYGRASRFLAVSQWVAGELVGAGVQTENIDLVFDAVGEIERSGEWSPSYPVVAPAFRKDAGKLSELTKEACRIAQTELTMSDDLRRDLQKASAFVYLTQSEGLGSAALLAMEAGVPVIASRVQGLAEVFEQDRSGLYVTCIGPDNDHNRCAKEVASCIRRVLDEPGLAGRLVAAARARVRDRFSVPNMVAGTIQSYERAIAG